MLVFLNDQIIEEKEAKISISDLSYQFGFGLFETIRCEQGIPIFFELHYKRLTNSAKEIGMPFPMEVDEVKIWIKNVLGANKLNNARLKLLISKKTDDKFNVLIIPSQLEQLPKSYSLIQWNLSRDSNSISFKHKTTSRADSFVAFKYATEKGFQDALFTNEKNEITECTRANVYLISEEKIITPNIESGILSGVTRTKLLEIAKKNNILFEEKNVNKLYLNKASEAFVTNAIIGIMPVSKIIFQDKEYIFSTFQKTTQLQCLYQEEVKEYCRKAS